MDQPRVLFLCSGNAARSQMAEAFLRNVAGDRFVAHSAGLEPKGIHPLTIRVMNEIGISLKGHFSKPLTDFLGKVPIRYAIVVCEDPEERCPRLWPFGATVLYWPFEDPATAVGQESAQLEVFRRVRDEIADRLRAWLREFDDEKADGTQTLGVR